MRIATYNVNGINGRLGNLLGWLDETAPDIVCLQELKAPDEKFPAAALLGAGYGAVWHGQKELERRGDPGAGRRPEGNPPRPAGRSRRYAEPLSRGGDRRPDCRLPLCVERQSGAGAKIRLQAALA